MLLLDASTLGVYSQPTRTVTLSGPIVEYAFTFDVSVGLVFADTHIDESGVAQPVERYHFERPVTVPAGTSMRWLCSAPYSVKVTCNAPIVVRTTDPVESLSFERLLFEGTGVAIESTVAHGVSLLDCDFVCTRNDFAIRGSLDGQHGPSAVLIRRCGFRECGMNRGGTLPAESPTSPMNLILGAFGIGAVWMPRTATGWTVKHCVFSACRSTPLRLHGSRATVLDTNLEGSRSDVDQLDPYIEVRSLDSVVVSRCRIGNEPLTPQNPIAVLPAFSGAAPGPELSTTPIRNVVIHSTHAQARHKEADGPIRGSMAVVDVRAPLRGFRVTELIVGNSVTGGIRLPSSSLLGQAGTTFHGSPQNLARHFGTSADSDSAAWFISGDAPGGDDLPPALSGAKPLLGQTFDIEGAWARVRLQRASDRWRATQNVLRSTEASPGTSVWPAPWIVSTHVADVTTAPGPWGPILGTLVTLNDPAGSASMSQANVILPADGSGFMDGPSVLVSFSVWAMMDLAVTLELRVAGGGEALAVERFAGVGHPRRFWVAAVVPAGVKSVSIEANLRGGKGAVAWLAWPQVEPGPAPTAYRRAALGEPGPPWPAESWSVGPVGVREGCPSTGAMHMHGDRFVAAMSRLQTSAVPSGFVWFTANGGPCRTSVFVGGKPAGSTSTQRASSKVVI